MPKSASASNRLRPPRSNPTSATTIKMSPTSHLNDTARRYVREDGRSAIVFPSVSVLSCPACTGHLHRSCFPSCVHVACHTACLTYRDVCMTLGTLGRTAPIASTAAKVSRPHLSASPALSPVRQMGQREGCRTPRRMPVCVGERGKATPVRVEVTTRAHETPRACPPLRAQSTEHARTPETPSYELRYAALPRHGFRHVPTSDSSGFVRRG